jgi:hypothetical protein
MPEPLAEEAKPPKRVKPFDEVQADPQSGRGELESLSDAAADVAKSSFGCNCDELEPVGLGTPPSAEPLLAVGCAP